MAVSRVLTRGWPVTIEMTQTMTAPPEVGWRLITDWEHQDDWMLEASDFVVVSDHREGVGVEAEATIRIGGLKTRDRVRVAEWDPPRRLVIEHLGWVTGRGEIDLTPLVGDRTHIAWREELSPPMGALGAVGMTAFKPLMGRIFRRDLKVLVGLARARARGASG